MKTAREWLIIHRQIERENAEHLRDFMEGGESDDVGGDEG